MKIEDSLDKIFGQPFLKLSKPLIKIFGLQAAVMLCELYSEYFYWKTKNELTGDGAFFSTVENIRNYTSLSRHQQDVAIDVLVEYGIIKQDVRGMPSKRYFKFNYSAVNKLLKDVLKENQLEKERIEKHYNSKNELYYDEYTNVNNGLSSDYVF